MTYESAHQRKAWVAATALAITVAMVLAGTLAYVEFSQQPATPITVSLPSQVTASLSPLSSSLGSVKFNLVTVRGDTLTFYNNATRTATFKAGPSPFLVQVFKGVQSVTVGSYAVPTGTIAVSYVGPFTVTTPAATAQFHSGSIQLDLNANGTVTESFQS